MPQSYCHNCGSSLNQGAFFCPNCGMRILANNDGSGSQTPALGKSHHVGRNVAIIALVLVFVLVLAAFASSYFIIPAGGSGTSTSSSSSSTFSLAVSSNASYSTTSTSSESQYSPYGPYDPDFANGSANISYPSNYSSLASYALSLINANRESFGVPPVSDSQITSGQQHADSMDFHGTIGHWDVQGYKPYMRYSMLSGRGSLDENVAFGYCTNDVTNSSYVLIAQCNFETIKNAILDGESAMMFNDSTCCNNGHRENILSEAHTGVSIGIAYNVTSSAVFFVEDFENLYLNFTTFSLTGGAVSFAGTFSRNADLTPWVGNPIQSGASVAVFYDSLPQPIDSLPTVSCVSKGTSCSAFSDCGSSSELNETTQCTYWGAYDPGTHLGAVFGPCPLGYNCSSNLPGGGTAVYASTWQASRTNFNIQFSLSTFIQQNGNGVYTLYMYPNNSNDTITSFSIFVG